MYYLLGCGPMISCSNVLLLEGHASEIFINFKNKYKEQTKPWLTEDQLHDRQSEKKSYFSEGFKTTPHSILRGEAEKDWEASSSMKATYHSKKKAEPTVFIAVLFFWKI